MRNLHDQGYFCVALSPFTKGNYNAKSAYDHFGFDLMLQPQDLGYPAPLGKNLWHIGSDEMLKYAEMILQKQHPLLQHVQQPMFVYVLTMKEHGPYHTDTPNHFNLVKDGLSQKTIACLNDYTQRIVALKQRNTPYVFAYFGDHQVAFDNCLPPKLGQYANPDYVTQVVVRSNMPSSFTQQQTFLDLAFLGGLLLEIAGLPVEDDFMCANIAMRILSEGKLEDAEAQSLVNDYRHYLYQHLKIAR